MIKTYWKSFLIGAGGALLVVVFVGLVASVYVLWQRASNGEQAFEYISRVVAAQQGPQPSGRGVPPQPPKP